MNVVEGGEAKWFTVLNVALSTRTTPQFVPNAALHFTALKRKAALTGDADT
jgi:hypothetical protein